MREVVSTDAAAASRNRRPRAITLLALFLVFAIILTLRDVTRLRTFVAGDSGDSLLNLWIMRSVQHGLPHGWHALWNAPIFHPAANTLAYSDTLIPVALVDWPLRLIVGDVLAFNLIYVGAWVLSSWCAYRLALRSVRDWRAALIGALTYTYATMRLVHQGHFQLVVGGALVPLVVLLMLRCLDAPSARRGAILGVAFSALALTASYYGAMMGVILLVVALGWLLTKGSNEIRSLARSLLVATAAVGLLVGPFAYEYLQLQRQPEFRRGFDPRSAAHLDDFAATGVNSYVLGHLPVIGSRSVPGSRGIENRLFLGFVASALGAVGIFVIAREARRKGWRQPRPRELLLITSAGLACVVLAFGDRVRVAHHSLPLPFILFRHAVPGFVGIRATARLAIGGQLALALLAAVGLDTLLKRWRRGARVFATGAFACLILAEGAMGSTLVRVPTAADDGGIADALRARPTGVVLELPIESVVSGAAWPYVEAPRELAAVRDGRPRVNGYSGFEPKHFDAIAAELDRFPAPGALAEAQRLGVRYVVLRTQLVGTVTPAALGRQLARDGVGLYSPSTARRIVDALPTAAVASVDSLPGGYLIELRT